MPKIDPKSHIQVRRPGNQNVIGLISRHPVLRKSYLVFWNDQKVGHFTAKSVEAESTVAAAFRLPGILRAGGFVVLKGVDDPKHVYWIEKLDGYASTVRRVLPGRGIGSETFRFKNKLLSPLQGHETDIHVYNRQTEDEKEASNLAREVEKLRDTLISSGQQDLLEGLEPSNLGQGQEGSNTEEEAPMNKTAWTNAGDDDMSKTAQSDSGPRFDSTKELMQYGVKLGLGKAAQEQAIEQLKERFPTQAAMFDNPMFLAGLKMAVPLMGLQLAGHIKSDRISTKVTDASQAMLLVNTIDGTAEVTGAVASQMMELGAFLLGLYGIGGEEAAATTHQLMQDFGVDADEVLGKTSTKGKVPA